LARSAHTIVLGRAFPRALIYKPGWYAQNGVSMKSLLIIGALLALVGIVTLAFPAFWTRDNKNVAQFGDVTIQHRENVLHVIPPTASVVAIVLGGGLIVAGVALKGRD